MELTPEWAASEGFIYAVHSADQVYLTSFMEPKSAVVVAGVLGDGTTIRVFDQMVWTEGEEGFSAWEYEGCPNFEERSQRAVDLMLAREAEGNLSL